MQGGQALSLGQRPKARRWHLGYRALLGFLTSRCDPALVRHHEGAGREALNEDHLAKISDGGRKLLRVVASHRSDYATKTPSYRSNPFTYGIFVSAMVATGRIVLGTHFWDYIPGLVVAKVSDTGWLRAGGSLCMLPPSPRLLSRQRLRPYTPLQNQAVWFAAA